MENAQEQQEQQQQQPANENNQNAAFEITSLPAIADDVPDREPKSMRNSKKKQTISDQFRMKKQQDFQRSQTLTQMPIEDQEGIKDKIRALVNHNVFSIVMSIITLYALFADDVRVIATDKDTDSIFWGFSCFCFVSFSVEIILCSISNPGYFLGFFFWLDVLSTASLILDIGWISNQIFSQNQGGKGSSASVASLAKASRASRVGTRAGRIVRVVRLVRLVRLYKHAQQVFAKQAKKFQEEQKRLREEQEQQAEQVSDSQGSSINLQQNGTPFQKINQTPMFPASQTPMLPANQTPMLPSNDPNSAGLDQLKNASPEMRDMTLSKGSPHKKNKSLTQIQPGKTDGANSNKLKRQASKVGASPQFELVEEDQKISQKDGSRSGKGSTIRGNRSMNRSANNSYHQSGSLGKSSNSSYTAAEKRAENSETKVGKTLSELTTKRVITIVLCIMFSLPIFDTTTYTTEDSAFNSSLSIIYSWKGNSNRFAESIQQYISYGKDLRTPLIYLQVENTEYYPLNAPGVDDYTQQRSDDITYYSFSDSNGNGVVTAVSSQKSDNKLDSILSIIRTIFVSVVLTFASMKFTSDVEVFILEPIEKMLEKVKRISKNPLEAAQMEEQEEFMIEQLREEGNDAELKRIQSTSQYETVILEKLIIRVGALLALGFGEAGSEIIAQNMNQSGVVDPMLPGNKIMAIFGFCDIRNFTDATEVLQTGVMVFVNEIAQIAHGIVDQYLGQANKNIGDAFLLVWKFKEKDYLRNIDGTLEFLKNDLTSNYADLSVIAFLKIQAGLTLSKNLQKYKKNPGLQARMKGYRVKMGFGLHFGWSIEGAIGSNYKIDASYLSPNVNMASRLEAATKQFGTGLLISGKLRDILTDKCQQQLRKIDCVTVKGSIEPMELYTVDTNLERLYNKRKGKDAFDFSKFTPIEKKKKKIVDKMIRNQLKVDIGKGTKRIATQFDTDPDLKEMRKEYTPAFYETWEKALEFYLAGRWFEASTVLKQTLQWFENRQDGPSQTLYEFLKENGFIAPKDWKGYRMLTEK